MIREKVIRPLPGLPVLLALQPNEAKVLALFETCSGTVGRPRWVSNLLVVLCGERGTQPVVNTGTLYNS